MRMKHPAEALNDFAIHPLRRRFPPLEAEPLDPEPSQRLENLRLFLMAYCAGFMGFSALIW